MWVRRWRGTGRIGSHLPLQFHTVLSNLAVPTMRLIFILRSVVLSQRSEKGRTSHLFSEFLHLVSNSIHFFFLFTAVNFKYGKSEFLKILFTYVCWLSTWIFARMFALLIENIKVVQFWVLFIISLTFPL